MILVIGFLMCGICFAFGAKTQPWEADDTFRPKNPIRFLRDTLKFLSLEPDQQLLQKLSELQSDLFQTNLSKVVEDALESDVLLGGGQFEIATGMPQRFQNLESSVDAADDTTTPSNNLTTPEINDTTAGTYSTTVMDNVTTAEYSTSGLENITTTALSNVTTPSPTPVPVNPECINDTVKFLEALVERKLWAVQMLDADGKPSPNLKGLQFLWVGDYEECTKVKATDNSSGMEQVLFHGRYCTAVVPFSPFDVRPLMPAVPPSGLRIGLCVPDSCSGQDITLLVNSVLSSRNTSFRVGLTTCQEAEVDYDAKAIVVLVICSVFLLLMTLGTTFDLLLIQWPARAARNSQSKCSFPVPNGDGYHVIGNHVRDRPVTVDVQKNGETEPLLGKHKKGADSQGETIGKAGKALLAFSVYTNGKKILTASHSPGSIQCIHGIRFLSMTWVILGHTFIYSVTTAENYVTYLNDTLGQWSFQAIIGAPVSVDTFFSLSGLLVTYLVLREMEKRDGKVQWFLFYFHRFWRLTPPYAFVLMLVVVMVRYMGEGPNWPQHGTEISYCQDTWWTNLLYVSNFVRAKEMCMGWSWYLANDMQFYIISPLLFVPLFMWRRVGVVLGLLWLLAAMLTAGLISRINHFPPGISVTDSSNAMEGMDYFLDFYIKPYCRFGPYVVGMLTGHALFVTKCQVRMSLVTSLSGWAVATATGLAIVYGLYEPSNNHPLTYDVSALYNAASHSVWGACVCWVIFACATGHGGPVNALLSWQAFIPLSRLTYLAYLVHPIIIIIFHLGAPAPFFMSTFHCAILFLGFSVAAFACAFLLSLAFEAPMMALEKVLLPAPKKH